MQTGLVQGNLAQGTLVKGTLAKGSLAQGTLAKGSLAQGTLVPGSLAQAGLGGSPRTKSAMPQFGGRPDYQLADALTKVSPKAQAKAKSTATDFEAMFLNSMFAQMTSGLKGEGPFGDTPGTGVWRSMLTEQYSKSFAKAGGVGIAHDVYRTLILHQANRTS